VRKFHLGVPQSVRNVFELLAQNDIISTDLAANLKRMADFRNIAVHDYQSVLKPILVRIISDLLNDFLKFSQALILQVSSKP
jgi:uncharacterized protein YutE (UPF0331/DUF86 family)